MSKKQWRVDREWLKEHNACPDGLKWWCKHCEGKTTRQQLLTLVKYRDDWSWWVLTKFLTVKQNRQLAVFAAKEVLPIFEKKFPDDKRPRKAIEAAEKVIECNTGENRAAAWAAAGDAAAADADAACGAARDAAKAAAYGAAWAADAARAAAAWAAADAGAANGDVVTKQKILKYGLTLLEEGLDI